ncbi:MAG: glutaredoxin [Deltaproteobacteria bacterium]|nr:glutaredoxin [Deltaproteobacteria bacterium]
MKKLLIIVLIICAGYFAYQHFSKPKLGPNARIVMYSLSYCKFCKSLSDELHNAGIQFDEYYIDQDKSKESELTRKLQEHKVPGGSIKMPVVDLGVALLPNRPTLAEIQSYIK